MFIDDSSLLTVSHIAFLNRISENIFSPIIILASNNLGLFQNFPRDFSERLLVIRTTHQDQTIVEKILKLRCEEELVPISSVTLTTTASLAVRFSIRFALQVISLANIYRIRIDDSPSVEPEHIKFVTDRFSS